MKSQLKPELFKNKYVELNTKETKEIIDLEEIHFMVEKLLMYSKYYLDELDILHKIINGKIDISDVNNLPNYNISQIAAMNGVSFFIVVTYYKIFDKAGKKRRYKPTGSEIYGTNMEYLEIHKNMMETRKKMVAHDDNFFISEMPRKLMIGVNNNSKIQIKNIGFDVDPLSALTDNFEKVIPLLDLIKSFVIEQIIIRKNLIHSRINGNRETFLKKLAMQEAIFDIDLK